MVSSLPYIASLDGLRAVAVLAVMAYHGGIPGAGGGFFGVDSFFVLSGFLITTLLVREFGGSGSIRLRRFWARRARRLLPALLLVLFVIGVVAHFASAPGSNPGLRSDAFFTFLYSANWHFIASGANYFTASGPISPLTHTWSLAIEEQFYLVWPLIVLAVLRVFRKSLENGLKLLLVVGSAGAVASTAWMATLFSGANDTRLYYGTDTHAQSMLAGAVVATALGLVAERRQTRGVLPKGRIWLRSTGEPAWIVTSGRGQRYVSMLGAVGLGITIFLWTHTSGDQAWLYHGGFLLGSLATAAIVVLLVAGQNPWLSVVLSVPPIVFVGRISYGLYLWHFPLFLWLDRANTGYSGWNLFIVRLAATMAVATTSYCLVEAPIRNGALGRGWRVAIVGSIAVVVAVSAISSGSLPAVGGQALASRVTRPQSPASVRVRVLTRSSALLVGDSLAQTLGDGWVGPVANFYGLDLVNLATANCSLATGVFRVMNVAPRFAAPPCQPLSGDPGWPTDWTQAVATYHPKVSIVLDRLDIVDRLHDGIWTHIGIPVFDAYLEQQILLAINVLTAQGGSVVFLTSPYFATGEQPGGLPWAEDDPGRVDRYNQLIRQAVAASGPRAAVLDLHAIADPGGHYTSTIDGQTIRFADGIHWTYLGDCWLAPRLLPEIARLATGAGSATTQGLPPGTCPNVP